MTSPRAIRTLGLVHIYRSEGFDVAALSGVDLTVNAGEVVGLLGPSGSGKSTLLALLGGLFRPSAGKIFVGDHELSALSGTQLDAFQARETSLMLQGAQRNLIPYLTVRENVAFAQGEARRLGAEVLGVERGLELVGATAFADAPLAQLSQGQLQMAALVVAMAPLPGVLLADEPTSALDRGARERIIDALLRVNEEQGTTVVVVTHDPEVADRLPRTVTIRDGRIGGEGRSGKEYAVVTADGFIPLPVHVRDELPPGTLLRLDHTDAGILIVPEVIGHEDAGGSTGQRADVGGS
jgi:putative ABC transport system ATP-binding protein